MPMFERGTVVTIGDATPTFSAHPFSTHNPHRYLPYTVLRNTNNSGNTYDLTTTMHACPECVDVRVLERTCSAPSPTERVCLRCENTLSESFFCLHCHNCAMCCLAHSEMCEICRRHFCIDTHVLCGDCGGCSACCRGAACSHCDGGVCGDFYCADCGACSEGCCTCGGRRRRRYSEDDRGYGLRSYSLDVTEVTSPAAHDVRTFGIELEVCAKNDSHFHQILAGIDAYENGLRDTWVPKSDGSLSEFGIELVSAPLSLEALSDAIRTLFEKTNLETHIVRDSHCGTHVHVGRSTVAPRTIARAWYPWSYSVKEFGRHYGATVEARRDSKQERENMQRVLRALAGREQNGYCAWSARPPVNLKERGAQHNDHYAAVSCSSHYPTYEFRMFAGATKVRSALRFLQTVDMLLAISEETQGMEVLRNHEAFLREIGKRIARYPELEATARLAGMRLSRFYSVIESGKNATSKKVTSYKRPGIDTPRSGRNVSHKDGLRIVRRAENAAKAKVLA